MKEGTSIREIIWWLVSSNDEFVYHNPSMEIPLSEELRKGYLLGQSLYEVFEPWDEVTSVYLQNNSYEIPLEWFKEFCKGLRWVEEDSLRPDRDRASFDLESDLYVCTSKGTYYIYAYSNSAQEWRFAPFRG